MINRDKILADFCKEYIKIYGHEPKNTLAVLHIVLDTLTAEDEGKRAAYNIDKWMLCRDRHCSHRWRVTPLTAEDEVIPLEVKYNMLVEHHKDHHVRLDALHKRAEALTAEDECPDCGIETYPTKDGNRWCTDCSKPITAEDECACDSEWHEQIAKRVIEEWLEGKVMPKAVYNWFGRLLDWLDRREI